MIMDEDIHWWTQNIEADTHELDDAYCYVKF